MESLPFDKPGRFYRGNLHTHSTRSDGMLAPAEVVAAYRTAGYDFVAVTDHFLARYDFPITDTRSLRTPDFTTLLGAELHGPALESGDMWHLLAVGLPLDFAALAEDESGPSIAARAAAAGAYVGIAHPAWYSLTLADALTLEAAHAVEVYNQTCTAHNDRGESWYMSEALAARGRRLHAFAADDAHFRPERPDSFGGWVQVRAEALEPAALLAALKAGRYYASQGPELHDIRVAGDSLVVACSPARAIFISGPGSRSEYRHGEGLTAADLPLTRFRGSYCRVTVVDAGGRRAWSNPIWLD